MENPSQFDDFKQHLDSLLLGSVPINTVFKTNVYEALEKYKKDKGLTHIQDVVRLATASFLIKAGYLHNNS